MPVDYLTEKQQIKKLKSVWCTYFEEAKSGAASQVLARIAAQTSMSFFDSKILVEILKWVKETSDSCQKSAKPSLENSVYLLSKSISEIIRDNHSNQNDSNFVRVAIFQVCKSVANTVKDNAIVLPARFWTALNEVIIDLRMNKSEKAKSINHSLKKNIH